MQVRCFPDRSSIRSRIVMTGALACAWMLFVGAAAGAAFSDVHPGLSGVTAAPASGALADGEEEVTIEVVVRDASGAPLADRVVRVASSNPADMIAQPVAPTDAQGKAIATMVTEVHGARVVWAIVDPDGEAIELTQQPLVYFEEPPIRPNVIVILVDDIGTDSLSMFDEVNPYQSDLPYVHGTVGQGDAPGNGPGTSNLYVHSPNLQALADEGVTFLNAYAMPVCSPSRACLLTGNYPARTGVGSVCRFDSTGGTLNELGDPGFEFPTLAQLATDVGYADILVGKWHLGQPTSDMYETDPLPTWTNFLGWSSIPLRGHFSEWIGVFSNLDTTPSPAPPDPSGVYGYYLSRNETDHTVIDDTIETEFITTLLFDEALTWCNSRTQPFLCVLTPTAAHSPWEQLPPMNFWSTPEYYQAPLNAWSGYMAQIEPLDAKIGDLVNGLLPQVRAKTTIILMGDNGIEAICLEQARMPGGTPSPGPTGSDKDLGATYDFLLDASPQRFKRSVYEKGTRVPMIVAGYGVTNPGRVSTALVDVTDVLPTVAELLGEPIPSPVHGISLLPILEDQVDYHTHARDFTYVEVFTPLGSTGSGAVLETRQIGCSLIIPGQGRYKIVYDQDLPNDELYKLQDANGDFLDPFETVELPHGPSDAEYANYLLVLAKMNEIIASGASSGPQTCTTSTNFCTSEPNSTGQPAVIGDSGPCSVSLNDYTLRAEPVPNQFGIFFYSTGVVNGGNGVPYGNGLRCVGGAGNAIYRLQITQAASNVLEHGLDFTNLPSGGEILPNSTWYFQAWYRDPAGGGAQFDFSDGLALTFGS